MSLTYELLKALARISGFKDRIFAGNPEDIVARARQRNDRNTIPELGDPEIEMGRITVDGCPVLTMTHTPRAKRATLFLIGGGMILSPSPSMIRKALKIAKETGLDLVVPYYPLCTEFPLTRAYAMILHTYEEMLLQYAPQNISFMGTSSGANLALGMIPYLNALKSELPRPGMILSISPSSCLNSAAEWKRMIELDKKDVLIPMQYMKDVEGILRHGEASVPEYMLRLQTGDFTGCPRVVFMYGSSECLYAFAPSFEAAMKRSHVAYTMIVGEDMFHCYPLYPLCPEAKAGWNQMITILKGKWQ
ncbi:MAG: alpha/beta hydrolase [Clostridia bacterium]|nr:alpha/beta hydrolase [Clostridia bacterium]